MLKNINHKITKKFVVNGAFDILHGGHIDLLNEAKSLGDHLTVAIDTDRRIKLNKGSDRPVNNQQTRKKILENIKAVDEVLFFDTDEDLISIIKECDYRMIGTDWQDKAIVGREHCKILFFSRVNNESTTRTIEDYINRRRL